ncbi:leucine-rich repeat-containing protein 15-like [Eupeodes corollae]|uniref:leucine-rich repeat-containing protein 15-like n=1 Tax=Eupeodes corollae TaxID=290404 RepID=UPI0024917853|nr:leucine-rich repeat-containing protein 15-like [Eupeodes corollae]
MVLPLSLVSASLSAVVFLLFVGYAMSVSLSIDLRRECNVNRTSCTLSGFSEDIDIVSDLKKDLPFTEVVFKHTRLQWIPLTLFSNVPKLKRLVVYNCGLRSLQQITFSSAINLRFLFLPSNRLTELPEKIFVSLSSIEDVRLADNHISHIHPKAFWGLKAIRHLDLNTNKIHELASRVFENLTTLEYIDLSYNFIESFGSEVFSKIPQLKTVLLNNNNIITFESNSFANFPHLTMLDVSNNAITSIDLQSVDTFRAQNSQLQRCVITGSVIRARVSSNQLKSIIISDKGSVKEIDVHNNLFETLSDFQGMLNLQKLDISKNVLRTLSGTNTTLLLDLPSLQYLNVANGQLESLSVENFILLNKLTHLDLAHNDLQNLDARVFEPLVGLEKLYLEENHLHSFDYEAFLRAQVNVKEMGILGNEWSKVLLKKMSEDLTVNGIKLVIRNQNEAGELLSHQTTTHPHHTIHAKTLEHETDYVAARMHQDVSYRDVMIVVTLCIVFVILVLQVARIFKEENWWSLFRQGVQRDVTSTRLNEEESGPF